MEKGDIPICIIIILAAVVVFGVNQQVEASQLPKPIYTVIPYPKTETPSVLEAIALCESGGSQFNQDGSVVTGVINSRDIGKWQISETYWLDTSLRLGYNIHTLEGNTLMALWIYENYGTQPWYLSEHCWGDL